MSFKNGPSNEFTTSLIFLPGKFVAARHVQGHLVVVVVGALGVAEFLLCAVKTRGLFADVWDAIQ